MAKSGSPMWFLLPVSGITGCAVEVCISSVKLKWTAWLAVPCPCWWLWHYRRGLCPIWCLSHAWLCVYRVSCSTPFMFRYREKGLSPLLMITDCELCRRSCLRIRRIRHIEGSVHHSNSPLQFHVVLGHCPVSLLLNVEYLSMQWFSETVFAWFVKLLWIFHVFVLTRRKFMRILIRVGFLLNSVLSNNWNPQNS